METLRLWNRAVVVALMATLSLAACGGVGEHHHGADEAEVSAPAPRVGFSMPSIPAMIVSRAERVEYMAMHYWDGFDLSDSLLVRSDSVRGVAVAGYVTLLSELRDSAMVAGSVKRMLDRVVAADDEVYDLFVGSLEDYLYDPNSPVRNEELYIPVLRYIVESDEIGEVDKMRVRYQLRMALKNRVGEVSADFEYLTDGGVTESMHSVEAKYLLLFFNNPDCEECARVKRIITQSPHLESLCRDGALKILAIDAESDEQLWRRSEYPKMMINGYDRQHVIMSQSLYDLKALPTLYLLDESKRVLLKDCAAEVAMGYLSGVVSPSSK